MLACRPDPAQARPVSHFFNSPAFLKYLLEKSKEHNWRIIKFKIKINWALLSPTNFVAGTLSDRNCAAKVNLSCACIGVYIYGLYLSISSLFSSSLFPIRFCENLNWFCDLVFDITLSVKNISSFCCCCCSNWL